MILSVGPRDSNVSLLSQQPRLNVTHKSLTRHDIENPSYAVEIFEDSSGCLALVQERRTTSRTKHVAVRINFIRDIIEAKVIKVIHCPTEFMITDPLTKPRSELWNSSGIPRYFPIRPGNAREGRVSMQVDRDPSRDTSRPLLEQPPDHATTLY